jgi:hypothetical protein
MAVNLNDIREGMRAYGPNGDEIGTVEFVYLSDEDPTTPSAETVQPNLPPERRTLIDQIADAFHGDDIPETLRQRLLRNGFVRLDATGLFAADRYVQPDQIASVAEDSITLTVGRDELVERGRRGLS